MIGLLDKPIFSKNNDSKSAFNRNNNSSPASKRNNGNNKIDECGSNDIEHTKKSGKLKGQKLAKFQKLSKLGKLKRKKLKKSLKTGNSPNFDAIEAGSSFLNPNAKITFNRL